MQFQGLCSFQCYSESSPNFLPNIFPIPHLWRSFPIIQSPLIYFHRPLVLHPISDSRIYPVKQIFIVFYGRWQLKVLFRGLLHINAARKAAVMHLMRWWQLFSQIFLCSYLFLVHLRFIFTAGVSWKSSRVRRWSLYRYLSNPRRMALSDQHPWILICSTIYYGAFPRAFFSSDILLLKNRTLSAVQRLKFWPPQQPLKILIFPSHPRRKSIILMCVRNYI